MNIQKAEAIARLKDGGVVTLEELIEEFKFSRTAAFNFFKRENCVSSINFKGRYHIKNSCLKFNRDGLAEKSGKIFSKYGNLLETISGLIENSDSGMTVSGINDLVGTKVHMQCCNLHGRGLIFRKKSHGVYCYFSSNKARRTVQMKGEVSVSEPVQLNSLLEAESSDSIQSVVKVLVAYIKNPDFTPGRIALSLMRQGNDIRTRQVAEVLNKYGIAKKNS